ncbi:MAG: IS4 family transposase [Candidatus Omnitrophica bacterium]|nr:IS4 family transposase [Candidatus Omnitrophota bacterium]
MHHNNTILGQMLKMFSRYEFQEAVLETGAEYHARGFTSWNHFVAMLFGQLSGQDSLRCIEAGLATQSKNLYHLGINPIHRSTLAYANEHRTHELFEKVFYHMLSKCQDIAPKHKFRFKSPLYSIDNTIIALCLSLYDWAKFRTIKGAVKVHIKLDHAGYLPTFMVVANGKDNDNKALPLIPLEKGDVAVFDMGYIDFSWFKSLDDKGIIFVTRMKKNAVYSVIEQRDVSKFKYILLDQTIKMIGYQTKDKCTNLLRRIRSRDPDTGKCINILTNNFTWSAKTIGQIYKERWQIELFFKAIKQQLKVKSFVGTSKNALLSQLWVALTAYLMLSYLKFKSKFGWSLYTLCSILPVNLFARRDIWDWFSAPFHERGNAPPENLQQLQFTF